MQLAYKIAICHYIRNKIIFLTKGKELYRLLVRYQVLFTKYI